MCLLTFMQAVIVRLVLLVHSLLVIWLATSLTQRQEYWILAIADATMIVEAVLTIVVNKGQEWKWFCPCFLAYLCSTIPGIWVLELKKTSFFNTNATLTELDDIQGFKVKLPVAFDLQTWVTIMEQLFLYLMILSRWCLPRGEITRNELSQLLFVFIGIASDITEFFALSDEPKIRENTTLYYVFLGVWTLSLLQFTLVLTATHSPKKKRVALAAGGVTTEFEIEEQTDNIIKAFLQTESWSICVNFLMQDGPFLSVRLYTMIAMKFMNYSIIFFTAKNALVVMLLVYRLMVLCCERSHRKPKTNHVSTTSSKHSLAISEGNQSVASIAIMTNNVMQRSLASMQYKEESKSKIPNEPKESNESKEASIDSIDGAIDSIDGDMNL